ncbi:DNA-3-methyladenine glycosylase family protein [Candidatus Spongiihabitans sp.]|uniref:DNA-3-methyladenine glycosylase family protein n=1 Tax=Candidatus Spongiihabitans sp. TaxID=3101308 RepID=UPI003C79DE96
MIIDCQSARSQANKVRQALIESELNQACQLDPGLTQVIDQVGYPEPRIRKPGFSTLVEIINAQQLSTKAAAAIWNRLEKSCRGAVTPRKILERTPAELRQCGLSARKIGYARALAERVLAKDVILETLEALTDSKVISELTKIKGIGRWSAEIYAIFALGRADIFPANDLALQTAVQRYQKLRSRPDEKQTSKIGEKWSPHRTSVALLMWKYYGATTLD